MVGAGASVAGSLGHGVRNPGFEPQPVTFLDTEQIASLTRTWFSQLCNRDLRECSRRSGWSSNYQGHGEGIPVMGRGRGGGPGPVSRPSCLWILCAALSLRFLIWKTRGVGLWDQTDLSSAPSVPLAL